ncbi:MAG: DUF2341 domain-containing protein [bacterium]|nr:DUF2341 domain-containing protein [bacterium]
MVFFIFFRNSEEAGATWWNDDWHYRKSITLTNNTTEETNVYASTTIDTSDSIKFQGDCGDLRFTSYLGEVLDYYIVSGCGTTETIVHFNFQTFYAGTQTVYYYYGNPTAGNIFKSSDFSTEASNYTIGATGSEEVGTGPVAYWSFNHGYGSTVYDETSSRYDGTITDAVWQNEEMCVNGSCLYFDGDDDYVEIPGAGWFDDVPDNFSVSAWIRPISLGQNSQGRILCSGGGSTSGPFTFMVYNGNALCLQTYDGTNDYECTGSDTISLNEWNYVESSYDSGVYNIYVNGRLILSKSGGRTGLSVASGVVRIGLRNSDTNRDFHGFIDELKVYPYTRTAAQVSQDYNDGMTGLSSKHGTALAMGEKGKKWMTDGLVAYWKMDETTWDGTADEVVDTSGNGDHGVRVGTASTTSGKFGRGGIFDGDSDYISGTIDELYRKDKTITAWIKIDSSGTNNFFHIGDVINDDTPTILFNVNSDGRLSSFGTKNNDGLDYLESVETLSTGEWYFVVFINDVDSEKYRLYLNGKETNYLSGTNGDYKDRYDSANNFYIGVGYNNGYFDGQIDEVRVYNRALSPREVRDLYNWAPGPTIYFKFDEGEGTSVYDLSGNNYTGTLTSMDQYTDWVPGKFGKGLDFDGSNDYVDVSTFDPHTYNEYTFSTWYKSSMSQSTDDQYLYVHEDGTDWIIFSITDDGGHTDQVRMATDDGTSRMYYGSSDVVDQKWHYITVVRDSSAIKIYVDGILETDTADGDTGESFVVDASSGPTIGDHPGDTEQVNGVMDDFKFYNYARTQKQIIQDMNAGHPAVGSPIGSPVGHWKFNEGFASTTYDFGLGDNDATLMSTTDWTTSGKFGKALDFNGSSDYVNIGDIDEIEFQDNFSFGSWVLSDTNGTNQTIISNLSVSVGGSSYGYKVDKTSSNYFKCWIDDSDIMVPTPEKFWVKLGRHD